MVYGTGSWQGEATVLSWCSTQMCSLHAKRHLMPTSWGFCLYDLDIISFQRLKNWTRCQRNHKILYFQALWDSFLIYVHLTKKRQWWEAGRARISSHKTDAPCHSCPLDRWRPWCPALHGICCPAHIPHLNSFSITSTIHEKTWWLSLCVLYTKMLWERFLDYLSLPEKNVVPHLPLFHDRATLTKLIIVR